MGKTRNKNVTKIETTFIIIQGGVWRRAEGAVPTSYWTI